jgi:hypothetical protein
MILLSLFDDIACFARFMARVFIFFQHEIIPSLQSRLDDEIKNGINVDLVRHLVIAVVSHLIKIDIRLEIVAHSRSAM